VHAANCLQYAGKFAQRQQGVTSKWTVEPAMAGVFLAKTTKTSIGARFFPIQRSVSMPAPVRNKGWRESMARSGQKNSAPLCAESISGSARSEVIKLIRHRLHEPLGPTLLVLQLLLREESLSPQGVALIRMLQRSIKEEVRAIQELLTIIETFVQEPAPSKGQAELR